MNPDQLLLEGTEQFNLQWLTEIVTNQYGKALDSLELTLYLLENRELMKYLDEQLEKAEELEFESGIREKSFRRTIRNTRKIRPRHYVQARGEAKYLLENLPPIDDPATIIQIGAATGIGLANGVVANLLKYSLTGYLAYATTIQTNENLRMAFGLATAYSAMTTAMIGVPSLPRVESYLSFVSLEEMAIRITKTVLGKRELSKLFKFSKSDFITPAKMAMFFEGAGLFITIPLEILRMFEIKEVSPYTLKLWKQIHTLSNYKTEMGLD